MILRPEDSIGYLIAQAGRATRNRAGQNIKAMGVDLTMEQGVILMVMGGRSQMSQSELTEFLGKDKSTIARVVDGMEKRTLLVRVQSETDKRKRTLVLTQKGKEERAPIEKAIIKTIKEGTAGIPQEDVAKCMQVLKLITANMDQASNGEGNTKGCLLTD